MPPVPPISQPTAMKSAVSAAKSSIVLTKFIGPLRPCGAGRRRPMIAHRDPGGIYVRAAERKRGPPGGCRGACPGRGGRPAAPPPRPRSGRPSSAGATARSRCATATGNAAGSRSTSEQSRKSDPFSRPPPATVTAISMSATASPLVSTDASTTPPDLATSTSPSGAGEMVAEMEGLIAGVVGVGVDRAQVDLVLPPGEVADLVAVGRAGRRFVTAGEDETVAAGAAAQDVGAVAAGQHVVAPAAVEAVGAVAAGQGVVEPGADDAFDVVEVVVLSARQADEARQGDVDTAAAFGVVDQVDPRAAVDGVVAGAALQQIVALIAVKPVVAECRRSGCRCRGRR